MSSLGMKPSGSPPRYGAPGSRTVQLGMTRQKLSQRPRHVSPTRPRSRTTCSIPAWRSSWLIESPAWPAPTTATSTVSVMIPPPGDPRDAPGPRPSHQVDDRMQLDAVRRHAFLPVDFIEEQHPGHGRERAAWDPGEVGGRGHPEPPDERRPGPGDPRPHARALGAGGVRELGDHGGTISRIRDHHVDVAVGLLLDVQEPGPDGVRDALSRRPAER